MSSDIADREFAAKHAWDWFALHAAQRMQTVNFFIVFEAALLAGAGVAMKEKITALTLISGAGAIVLAIVFFFLERRVRQLVKIGEDALRSEQDRLAEDLKNPNLRMFALADRAAEIQFTYGKLFPFMFIFFGLVGCFISAIAAIQICHGASLIPPVT